MISQRGIQETIKDIDLAAISIPEKVESKFELQEPLRVELGEAIPNFGLLRGRKLGFGSVGGEVSGGWAVWDLVKGGFGADGARVAVLVAKIICSNLTVFWETDHQVVACQPLFFGIFKLIEIDRRKEDGEASD